MFQGESNGFSQRRSNGDLVRLQAEQIIGQGGAVI